jgi:lysophospholipase L1-like esterase
VKRASVHPGEQPEQHGLRTTDFKIGDDVQDLHLLASRWLLACLSLLASFVVLEAFVFRVVLPAPDVPVMEMQNDILKYRPNQRGIWRVHDTIAAEFRINAQGYNSSRPTYIRERDGHKRRIAVIGDSYVAALQVPPEKSFGEVLESELGTDAWEAYRFGVDGYPLSQYLFLLEHEVASYRPDVVVVNLVHNDFVESFRRRTGRYTRSLMVLRLENGKVLGEIPPEPFRESRLGWVRNLAIVRFYLYRQQLTGSRVATELKRLLYAGGAPRYEANVDVGELDASLGDVTVAAEYLLSRLKQVCDREGFRLVLVIDGVRRAIMSGEPEPDAERLNGIVADVAARHGIELVDLQPVFASAWQRDHVALGFRDDGHWNEYCHRLVGEAVARQIAGTPGEGGR